ncbi:NAD(P)-binding protein [Coniochaeta ligniaria NRRL 30616]|uniref:NAD(P)-binding protein n=1 Tax=Coniochaeta ligniaria NRRL 30616 TaxID=1408157 RepID=A0A1J7JJB0_9PEZI|nr:NAD(P)-binding protein [Coniochaeta ligniaria NRRL 30616]
MSAKIVTILGATGNQGNGVLSALLQDPAKYHIRAVTRRPDGETAKTLQARGVEIVQADLNNLESLKAAFAGSHVVYAVTNFFEPFAAFGPEKAVDVEAQQGTNVAKAAAATDSLEHFIWSTLPNSTKVSGGKYTVPHFEGKNRTDSFIRQEKDLLAKTTFLWVTWYDSNYNFPMFTPYHIPTSGKYVQFTSYSPDTPFTTIGDVRANIGPFVRAILDKPQQTRNGAIVRADIATLTSDELLKTWAVVQGKEAISVRTDVETYNALWPMWAEEMGLMVRFWDEFAERSWTEPGDKVLTRDDLGLAEADFVDLATSFKELKY